MAALAGSRPVFHSEADFQHAFAWELHGAYPSAAVRLETRPRQGVRLDPLATIDGLRIAIEFKYLLRRLVVDIGGETFDLPNHGAQDISRYDVIKDVVRLEANSARRGCGLRHRARERLVVLAARDERGRDRRRISPPRGAGAVRESRLE